MKKLIIISMVMMSSLSFSNFFNKIKSSIKSEYEKIKSEIKLKAEETPRFREIAVNRNGKTEMRKVIPGRYVIRLFEINYPVGIEEKDKFYNDFNDFLEKVEIQNRQNKSRKKYSLLIDKRFFEDMQNMKFDIFSEEEKMLETGASSLTEEQISRLMNMSRELVLKDYLGTDQEYLNRQIYLLHKLLGKTDYNGDSVYSELEKEFLIAELKQKRKKTIENFEKMKFEYFIKENYTTVGFNKFEDDTVYKFDKDIVVSENIEDQAILPDMKEKVYLIGFPDKVIEDLEKNKIKLKRNLLLIENDKFHGYTFNENNSVIFIGGKYQSYYYNDYKIDVVRESINIENLFNESSNYYVSDFFN